MTEPIPCKTCIVLPVCKNKKIIECHILFDILETEYIDNNYRSMDPRAIKTKKKIMETLPTIKKLFRSTKPRDRSYNGKLLFDHFDFVNFYMGDLI